MSVQIIGLDSFISALGIAKEQTKPLVEKAALNLALKVRTLAQEKVHKVTTALAQSIQAEPIAYGAMTTVEESYGIYVEYGTGMYDPRGSHLIYSSTGGALHWESDGEDVFAMWTRGMEAQPYFWPAVAEVEPTVAEEMGKVADLLIQTAVAS